MCRRRGGLQALGLGWLALGGSGKDDPSKRTKTRRALSGIFTRRLGMDKSKGRGPAECTGRSSDEMLGAAEQPKPVSPKSVPGQSGGAGDNSPRNLNHAVVTTEADNTPTSAVLGDSKENGEDNRGEDRKERHDGMVVDALSWLDDVHGSSTRGKGKTVRRNPGSEPEAPYKTHRRSHWLSPSSSSSDHPEPRPRQRRYRRRHDHVRSEAHRPSQSVAELHKSSSDSGTTTKSRLWDRAANLGARISAPWYGLSHNGGMDDSAIKTNPSQKKGVSATELFETPSRRTTECSGGDISSFDKCGELSQSDTAGGKTWGWARFARYKP